MFIDKDCNRCGEKCLDANAPLFPVIYSDIRYDATTYAILYALHKEFRERFKDFCGCEFDDINEPVMTILQKSKDWAYEREWRIVCKDICKIRYALKPDAIVIGANATLGAWKKLVEIARNQELKVFKEDIGYFSEEYRVPIRELSEGEIKAVINLNIDENTTIA